MTTPDVHTLAGPYVLNALPDAERGSFEEHLGTCSACAAEIRDLRQAAGRLGGAVAVIPPPLLKARVIVEVNATRQLPPLARHRGPADPADPVDVADSGPVHAMGTAGPRRFGRRSLLAIAAGVAAVASIGVAADQYHDNQTGRRDSAALISVLSQPDARTVRGTVTGGGRATMVSSVRSDTAVVVLHDLHRLSGDRTYQLWLIDKSQRAHSVGLVGGRTGDRQLQLNDPGLGDKTMFGITEEPRGGSPEPTLPAASLIALV